jgi:hypothetical protein
VPDERLLKSKLFYHLRGRRDTARHGNVGLKPEQEECEPLFMYIYEGVSKIFRTESITKWTTTKIIDTRETTQRVMAAKFTRQIHKIAIQLHLVAESSIICSSRSRRPVRKLSDTSPYVFIMTWCLVKHRGNCDVTSTFSKAWPLVPGLSVSQGIYSPRELKVPRNLALGCYVFSFRQWNHVNLPCWKRSVTRFTSFL